eukprot:1054151_1
MAKHWLTLFTKHGCTLCEPVKFILKKTITMYPATLKYNEIDIEALGNEVWFEKYRYEIPIVHLDDEQIFKHSISERELHKILCDRNILNPEIKPHRK